MKPTLAEVASKGNPLAVRRSEKCLQKAVNVMTCESLLYVRGYSTRILVSRMVKCVLFDR